MEECKVAKGFWHLSVQQSSFEDGTDCGETHCDVVIRSLSSPSPSFVTMQASLFSSLKGSSGSCLGFEFDISSFLCTGEMSTEARRSS